MLSFPDEITHSHAVSNGWASTTEPSADGLRASGFSDAGRMRPSNQDRFHVDEGLGLLVVADGIGGHAGGAVASQMAVDEVAQSVCRTAEMRPHERRYQQGIGIGQWPYGFDRALSMDGNRLRTAIYAAHMRLLETAASDPTLQGMGTTIVAAVERSGRLSVAWAGDSRLYLLRGGRLRCLTRDDSWAEALAGMAPQVPPAHLRSQRDGLTNALGSLSRMQVHSTDLAIHAGDVLALTTDGVHGWLDDRSLARVLGRTSEPAEAAADLVAAAIGCGSGDNCTAVVAHA